jgi:protoheme IX farnesyltransferase
MMEAATADIESPRVITAREKLSAYLELTKPRIAVLLVLTSAAGFYVGGYGNFDSLLFINSMIGIALLAFGVATLNQYIERYIDVLMARTSSRPLPTGKITPNEALVFGLAQCIAAEIYLWVLVNPLTALLGLTVIIGYVLLYTPLKTKTTACTAIGAIPGAMPPLMGWTAATNDVTLGAWALFATQFLWQFPHFLAIAWMYREEYARAGIKMLPAVEASGRLTARQIVIFTIMLVPVSLAPYFLHIAGVLYLLGALVLGLWFLWKSISAARVRTNDAARRLLVASVLYLPLLFILLVIDRV